MSTLLLVPKLLYRPGETLALVALRRPPWRLPLSIAASGIAAISAGTLSYLIEAVQTTSQGIVRADPSTNLFASSSWITWGTNVLIMTTMLPVIWLLQGLVLTLVSYLGATPLKIRETMGLIPWLWLPLALRMVAHGLYLLFADPFVDNGLSFLVPRGPGLAPLSSVSWQFLWQWDLFFLWHLVLVGIVLYRFSRAEINRVIDGTLLYGLMTALGMALLATWSQPG